MGPRPSSRGYPGGSAELTALLTLQWGRDLVVADTWLDEQGKSPATTLQWGRDLVVADTTGNPPSRV